MNDMKFTSWDLMKLSAAFDGDFCLSDFSEEELEELLQIASEEESPAEIRRRYFEYHDDVKDRTLDKHKWSD